MDKNSLCAMDQLSAAGTNSLNIQSVPEAFSCEDGYEFLL